MQQNSKTSIPQISWAVESKKSKKSAESIAVMWVFAIGFSIVAFILSGNYINSLLILSAAFALHAHFINMPEKQKTRYTLTLKGLRVNGLLYPYKNIRAYNIVTNEEGKRFLILDIKSILVPDMVIDVSELDEEELDFYLSRFVEEDSKMQIPVTHTLAEKLGM